MRRYTILLLLVLGLSLMSFVVWAQDSPDDTSKQDTPIIVANPPGQIIAGTTEWQPLQLTSVPNPSILDIPFLTNDASDSCDAATVLALPSGETTTINALTEELSDPILSCMWGAPSRIQGYRTAWYQFTAPHSGRVRIDTFGSNYDTVLAVYSGNCGSLTPVTCVDDTNGFTSQTTLTVHKDETYIIEVADWDFGATTEKSLRIAVLMEPINSFWTQETLMPLALSRHATTVVGNDIYVIGGQPSFTDPPTITNFFQRYETSTGNWVDPTDSEAPYYSNSTAAFVDGTNDNGRIYLPSGYTGGSAYDMTHWAYDIQGGFWLPRTSVPGAPFAWATAVAVASPDPGYYIIGGLNTIDPPSSTLHVRNEMLFYAPAINSWLPKTSMNDARYAHTGALVNGKVCVVGGIKHDGSNSILLPDGECYTPGVGWAMIAPMNYPRYSAGSAVRPDGKWIVFGGINADNNAVAEMEVYNPAANSWTVMGINYNLGGSDTLPARAWPRGGVVGNNLWAIGGNNMPDQQPLSLVERVFLPTNNLLLPIVISNDGSDNQPDDHFGIARPLTLNIPQYHNFDSLDDHYDVYYFDLPASATVTVQLNQIPSGSNYDISIYNANKHRESKGENLGNLDESVQLPLAAGRYYVMVSREFPIGDPDTANYRLLVQQ